MDTYAAHMPSENAYGDLRSMRSRASRTTSKAYGMEHGNWLGMDSSL